MTRTMGVFGSRSYQDPDRSDRGMTVRRTTVLQTLTALTQSVAVITHGYMSHAHDEVRWVTRTVLRHDGHELDRQEWTGPDRT